MKSLIQPVLLGLFLIVLPAGLAHAQTANDLDLWAKEKIEDTLQGCSHRSPKEVFGKLKKLEIEYSTKADLTSLTLLKSMPSDSEFIQMGQVIFPAVLPRGFPARLIYMACDEEHRAFIESKTTTESKETLLELTDCFRRNYRIRTPKTVTILLKCYEELHPASI